MDVGVLCQFVQALLRPQRPMGKFLCQATEMSQTLFGSISRRGAGRIIPDSTGRDPMSPEQRQDISGAGSILEA